MKKTRWNFIIQAAVLTLAAACLLSVLLHNDQAAMSVPVPVSFSGEYSQNGEAWKPLTADAGLSALDGDLILRGHLNYEVPEGARLNFYLNHIGYSIYINGELCTMSTAMYYAQEGRSLTPSVCGEWWSYIISPGITPEDTLEIHLHNFHIYGNTGAYRDFLKTLCISPDSADILEKSLEAYSRPFEIVGWTLLVAAVMLIGASVISVIKKMPDSKTLWRYGLLTLFVGGFFLLDTIDFSFLKGILAFNTYGRQLCMMLALFYAGLCASDALTGRWRKAAKAAVLLSGIFDGVLILLSLCGVTVLYDTTLYWAVSQFILCPLLLILCAVELYRGGGEDRSVLISGIALFIAAPLDLWGVGESIFSQGTCTKAVFVLLFLFHVVKAGRNAVVNHQASIRAKTLERELEDSRIAIMLSQIQPHFLYNSLGTIEELCHSEPLAAEAAIGRFTEFLKGNMKALTTNKPIPFEEELAHTKNYLEIETLRFGDQMNVRFEIEAVNFMIPTLTLQPIVENAVRHGLRKREGGGTLVISSRKYPDRFEVVVEDNGVGFDPDQTPDDGKPHVGIQNVRKRLYRMCGGELRITSAPGQGTRAVLILPKEGEPC